MVGSPLLTGSPLRIKPILPVTSPSETLTPVPAAHGAGNAEDMHVHFSSQLQPVGGVEGTLDHMCVSPIQPNLLLGPLGAVNPGRGREGVMAQIQQRVSGRRGSTSKAE